MGDTTLIIGAGPAGLAMARALRARGIDYTHVDSLSGPGGIWDIDAPGTPMYESAHFISSRTASGFAGFPMPDDYPDYPDHRRILAYLRAFADAYDLTDQIRFGTEVTALQREGDRWQVTYGDGLGEEFASVIVCTGAQWVPSLPELPGFTGEVRHSATYRSADEFRGRRVLIVGGGNSGCDIACDAAAAADHASISLRRGYCSSPSTCSASPPTSSEERARSCRSASSVPPCSRCCASWSATSRGSGWRSPTTSCLKPTPS